MSLKGLLFLLAALQAVSGLLEYEIEAFKAKDYVETWSGAKPRINITSVDASSLLVSFNAIPAHYTGQFDGQARPQILEQDLSFKIKRFPDKASEVLWCLPLGIIGVTIGGVPIYNPYAPEPGCKYAKNVLYLDACNGRTDDDGVYHYYGYSPCVQMFSCDSPTEIYGVAIDGYPIYGPYDEFGNVVTGADLDECGGRLDIFGNYRYHLTVDQPNVLWCLKGWIRPDLGLNVDNFVCNCPYTDSHFEDPDILPMCNETMDNSTANSTENSTMEDATNTRRRRDIETTDLISEVELVFNETLLNCTNGTELTGNSTVGFNCTPIVIPPKTCTTQEEYDAMYTNTVWGGRNTTNPAVCNFTNPYNIVLCEINETALWRERPSWEYETRFVNMYQCCPKELNCSGSCWIEIDADDNPDSHLNPECRVDNVQITYKKRVMVPSSSLRPSYLWTPLIIFVLPLMRPLAD